MSSRLAVVGCDASGKTVFMAALADHYRLDRGDASACCLVPENAAAHRFAAYVRRQMRGLREWPPATDPDRTAKLCWTLRRAGETLADVEMLEFGGEAFRAAFREPDDEEEKPRHRAAVRALMDYLGGADFVVVLVSLAELLRAPAAVAETDFARDVESAWVTRGLLDFLQGRLGGAAGVVIGLTQADKYRAELAAAGGAAALFARQWPTIRAAYPNVPVVEVASVSGVDAEGRPVEGYATDGILSVMREFARQTLGSGTELRQRLAREGQVADEDTAAADAQDPMRPSARANAYAARVKKYAAAVADFKRWAALAGEDVAEETAAHAQRLAVCTTRLGELKAAARAAGAANRGKAKGRKKALDGARARRGFWAALAAAALVAGALCAWGPWTGGAGPRGARTLPRADVLPVVVTNVVSVPVAVTNLVPVAVTNLVPVAVTNVVPVTVTNVVPVVVTNVVTRAQTPAEIFAARLARAKAGELQYMKWVAETYYNGSKYAAQDHAQAFAWFKTLAESGDAAAQTSLAVMYEEGQGTKKNPLKALEWYREAAENGAADAMYRLGVLAWEDRAAATNGVEKAHRWFEKAKAAGSTADNLEEWLRQTEKRREVGK